MDNDSMNKLFLKSLIEHMPYPVGAAMSYIPFSFRLGKDYKIYENLIQESNQWSDDQKTAYIISNFKRIFNYAKENYLFYQKLYKEAGVFDLEINSLEDISRIPIIEKNDIRNSLNQFKKGMLLNTGGTSGEPFQFYVDKNAFAREWAHMHYIWKLKGYRTTDIKLTLRGRNLGDRSFAYNSVYNEFIVNTYKSVDSYKRELIELFRKHKIKFLHGYPSAVYGFLKEVDEFCNLEEKDIIKKNLQCCFLGSEYPVDYMSKYITEEWKLDYISWYGHSEMCILAYDENKENRYKPFLTYGYTENIEGQLIGTSFHNYNMPLIRYNTSDLIEYQKCYDRSVEYFSISQGRSGDFIRDKKGKEISLTALVFGRHHKIFGMVDYIQVSQETDGLILFHISTKNNYSKEELISAMDLSNLDVEADFEIRESPIKTKAGKIKIKI
ncbi:phenylacetate--CoA ligase family protein [Dysgonomonas reticulitermitis]